MQVEVRYIERVSLYEEPFIRVVQEYTKKLKHNFVVVFDLRLKNFGTHMWDADKKIHIIRLSPVLCKFKKNVRLGPIAEKYRIIGSLLHEIRHAQQYEELGDKFWNKKYVKVKAITNPDVSDWYSECERDARIYEDLHIKDAIILYDSSC